MHGFTVWVSSHPLCIPRAERTSDSGSNGRGAAAPCLQWGVSPHLGCETAYLPQGAALFAVTPDLPLWLAEAVADRLAPACSKQRPGALPPWRLWLLRRRASRFAAAWGCPGRAPVLPALAPPVALDNLSPLAPGVDEELVQALALALGPRRLTVAELCRRLKPGLAPQGGWAERLHGLVLAGVLQREAAVGLNGCGELACRRCGSRQIVRSWCARCGSECPTCLACAALGAVRGCDGLYALAPAEARRYSLAARTPASRPALNLPFQLSPAQAQAAAEVRRAVQDGAKSVLVWAACGAGKTEVLYETMRDELAAGQRVLLATPRRDICAELCERLSQVFGPDMVTGYYGGAQDPGGGPVVVATTHQAVRLAPVFHLVVLDECDAYPYTADEMLQAAIARLAAAGGTFVQMTATPPPRLRRRLSAGLRVVYIPARHHGHPLPVPELVCERALHRLLVACEQGRPAPAAPGLARAAVAAQADSAQLLVFVPKRTLVAPVAQLMQQLGFARVVGVHAQSRERDGVRQAFAAGELDCVVSTTVFERGLTFPRADAAVLFADCSRVFDRAALVQMAGRVGRSPVRPRGRVWFLAAHATAEMRGAVADIQALNRVAEERGLLTAQH